MTFKRWLPTFLAFPLGGLIAIETVGSLHDPASAAAGGLLVGAIVGAAQGLALGSRRWAGFTAAAMTAGAALAATVTGAGTEVADVVVSGLVVGAAVGAAQSRLLPGGGRVAAAWTAVTAASWALGWLVTSAVIVDLDRGHHIFGASGALVATVVCGLALHRILGASASVARPAAAVGA